MSRIPRVRAASAAILAAFVAVLGLAFAPQAAYAVTVDDTAAVSQPTILAGQTGQTAGDITMTINGPVTAGDIVTFTLDDANGLTCQAGDTLAWSAVPTISVTATVAGAVSTISPTLTSSAGPCTTAGVRDVLQIQFGASAIDQTVRLSNVKYDVGAGVQRGPVQVAISDGGGNVSNAVITDVQVTANNPATAVTAGGGAQGISNVVVRELTARALENGENYCVTITDAPTGTSFATTGATPTVTGAGGDTATGLTVTGNQVRFTVTGTVPSASISTLTLSGLAITPGSTGGQVRASFGPCGGPAIVEDVLLTTVVAVTRLQGADRFATARAIAADLGTNQNVIVARADLPYDSLAASYLSGKYGFAPILLVNTQAPVPADTLAAIQQTQALTVTIVGGPQAVSQAVQDALANTNASNGSKLTVRRIGGVDRYETARRIATDATTSGGGGAGTLNGRKTAILATGENFADALVGGPISSRAAFPVLLTNRNSLNQHASAAMTELGIQHVVILGGPVAVSTTVENAIPASITKTRLFGADRQATSVEIAKFARRATSGSTLGLGWGSLANGDLIHLARGDNFADSLTGGPEAGQEQSPIILTAGPTSLGTAATDYLRSLAAPTDGGSAVTRIHVFGGVEALSAAVVTAAQNALTGA